MQGIRNLIHRRRPSALFDPEALPEKPVPAHDAPDGTPERTPDGTMDAQQIEQARAGRNRVPGPEALQPKPFLPTMGEERPVKPAAARPQIWDIDPPKHAKPDAPGQTEAERSAILAKCAEDPLSPALRDTPQAKDVARAPARKPAPNPPPQKGQNRAKTRLLGFHGECAQPDVFAAPPASGGTADPRFPIGWIVVIEGPGRGASFTLTAGLSTVGRDAAQTIVLDFGDTAISRENHVAIAFDEEENRAFIGHGGKSNIVRLNDKPLLTTETLEHGDTIRIGKTVLRFVGFCAGDFAWADGAADG